MTLEEMKKETYRLIEEIDTDVNSKDYTKDPDLKEKINGVINRIMFELIRYKKILVTDSIDVLENEELSLSEEYNDFYQLKKITGVDFEIDDNIVTFLEDGKAKIYYYKYPKRITTETEDTKYKFESSQDVLEIMPFGIAADLLKSDVSSNYGQVYANRYAELKQTLDPRYSLGSIKIEGGIDV